MRTLKIKKFFMLASVFLLTMLLTNLTYHVSNIRVEAADVASNIKVTYTGINEGTEVSEEVVHSVIYTYYSDLSMRDTTGHIELISPSQNDAYSKFYKKGTVDEEVVGNQLNDATKNTKVVKTYNEIITGWRLTSITKNGIKYSNIDPLVPETSEIGMVFAEKGWINIFAGVTEMTLEAVYGRAIYVRSPYDHQYYENLSFIFEKGTNKDGTTDEKSSDDNYGTSQNDPVSTFRRAYELINESASNSPSHITSGLVISALFIRYKVFIFVSDSNHIFNSFLSLFIFLAGLYLFVICSPSSFL